MLKKIAGNSVVAIAVAVSMNTAGIVSVQAASFNEAMTGGTFKGSFRPRIEFVDQENISDSALATTVRGAFQYTTGAWNGLQLKAELESVMGIGSEKYNSTANGKTQYPVVADPSGGHFNRMFLFHRAENYTVGYGRDEIIYDNWRWVGNVGWRQNHQTFNSAKIDGSAGALSYHVAYVTKRMNVKTYAGGDDMRSSYFLNGGYDLSFGKLSGYYYGYEFDDGTNVATQTYGASLSGAPGSFIYRAEVAAQKRDKANAGADASVNYYHMIAGLKVSAMKFLLGYELLGSDSGNYGMKADFGTNHKFNGFADQFLSTPKAGLKDSYATAVVPFAGMKFVATYHIFKPDNSSSFNDYGTEIDLVLARKLNKQVSLLAKYAGYSAKKNSANPKNNDVSKLIVQAAYKF